MIILNLLVASVLPDSLLATFKSNGNRVSASTGLVPENGSYAIASDNPLVTSSHRGRIYRTI